MIAASMVVLWVLWGIIRKLLALAALALFVAAVTTLFGWFSIQVEGNEIAWYWLLSASFVFGVIGMAGDKLLGLD